MVKKITLHGRVQGVGCRGYCASYGKKLGLRGSATNMRDGSVVVLIESENIEQVRLYIDYLLSNPSGNYFHGKIDRYTIEDYAGLLSGDYRF
jgi:acylphosphatase